MTKEELQHCIQIDNYKVYVILPSVPGNRIVAFEDILTWSLKPFSKYILVYLSSSLHYIKCYLSSNDMKTLWMMAQKEAYRQTGLEYLEKGRFHFRAELLIIDKK